ncbi:radical SAM family heme chaperone HemW [Balneolaceae bacterium ANBcel3]|nr:radical SAM family heme chaperone HemW [Balneolaceae bacterium ANBcel3]
MNFDGIYIHVPFCKQACSYCDFYFTTRSKYIPEFVHTLQREVMQFPEYVSGIVKTLPEEVQRPDFSNPTDTLYFGGGTPSRLKIPDLQSILFSLRSVFNLNLLREFTVEVNPEDINPEYLSGLKEMGVTRLSMGIQTFKPELLTFMHRAHDTQQAEHALALVSQAGFDAFSVDVIYGCPGQSLEDVQDDLDRLLAYNPHHVSAYSLTIEPATRLGKQFKLGRIRPPVDDLVHSQATFIREHLAKNGIIQYEISNYARPGFEAIHNASYWSHKNYVGLGPSAHSFLWPVDHHSAFRFSNPASLKDYVQCVEEPPSAPVNLETLSYSELAEERILLGLRTKSGVYSDRLSSRYRYSWSPPQQTLIQELRKDGLLEPDEPLRLTASGRMLADSIVLKLLRLN